MRMRLYAHFQRFQGRRVVAPFNVVQSCAYLEGGSCPKEAMHKTCQVLFLICLPINNFLPSSRPGAFFHLKVKNYHLMTASGTGKSLDCGRRTRLCYVATQHQLLAYFNEGICCYCNIQAQKLLCSKQGTMLKDLDVKATAVSWQAESTAIHAGYKGYHCFLP